MKVGSCNLRDRLRNMIHKKSHLIENGKIVSLSHHVSQSASTFLIGLNALMSFERTEGDCMLGFQAFRQQSLITNTADVSIPLTWPTAKTAEDSISTVITPSDL